MPELHRRHGLTRGPRFFTSVDADGIRLMFVNQLDTSSSIGPRPAYEEDAKEHPAAWVAFLETLDGDVATPELPAAPKPVRAKGAKAA